MAQEPNHKAHVQVMIVVPVAIPEDGDQDDIDDAYDEAYAAVRDHVRGFLDALPRIPNEWYFVGDPEFVPIREEE